MHISYGFAVFLGFRPLQVLFSIVLIDGVLRPSLLNCSAWTGSSSPTLVRLSGDVLGVRAHLVGTQTTVVRLVVEVFEMLEL